MEQTHGKSFTNISRRRNEVPGLEAVEFEDCVIAQLRLICIGFFMLRTLGFNNLPPFGSLRIQFPPIAEKSAELAEVQLLTGVNGTGKTRILSAVAALLGQPTPLSRRLKGTTNRIEVFAHRKPHPDLTINDAHAFNQFQGQSLGGKRRLSPHGSWFDEVPAFAYRGSAYVSDATITAMATVQKPNRENCLSFLFPEKSSQDLLQAVTNLKVQAAMDSMKKAPSQRDASRSALILAALESSLTEITGTRFEFDLTAHPVVALQVTWAGATLPFDLLPDGLRSIIGWLVHAVVMMDAWLQGRGDPMGTEVVFLLDEIETHLHPAWQRRILPAFQRLFPKAQIFIATHSPFVIASLNQGWIHRFRLLPDGKVTVDEPKAASEGDSYVSVVEDIMGIEEWYDPESESLLKSFRVKRDAAYQGIDGAEAEARGIASIIAKRSIELSYMMGREIAQMERQLKKPGNSQ